MSQSICDISIEILRATHDGDELDPRDLKLLELAVNGFLSEQSEIAFYELYKRVQDGYIHWKGMEVKHYNIPWAYGEKAKEAAEELARRCRILDERSVKPTFTSVYVQWKDGE